MSVDVDAYAEEHDVDLSVLEPRSVYDACILSVVTMESGRHVVVYDWEKCLEATMIDQEWDVDEAKDWLAYCTGHVEFASDLDEECP